MNLEIKQIIDTLKLVPHPEGGFYTETFRSHHIVLTEGNERTALTSIYFLLPKGSKSCFHRIKSDELWNYHHGGPLQIIEITHAGELKETILGPHIQKGELLQYVVPAGHWFGSIPKKGSKYCLVGCAVAPGFEFKDFEMAAKENLLQSFPQHKKMIEFLTHP